MNVLGKIKDNEKTQMDLSLYCRRKELELKSHPHGKMFKAESKLHTCNLAHKTCVSMAKRS